MMAAATACILIAATSSLRLPIHTVLLLFTLLLLLPTLTVPLLLPTHCCSLLAAVSLLTRHVAR